MKREGFTLTDFADYYYFDHGKFNSRYGEQIIRIVPHHMAGNMSPEQYYALLKSNEYNASCTVAVFSNGEVWAIAPEEMRPWTTGGQVVDGGALTLEIANDGGANTDWHISDEAYQSAIKVMADWCKRYKIDPRYTYRGAGLNMHQDWASTACPGPYLKSKIISGQMERDIRRAMNERDEVKLGEFVDLLYANILNRKSDKVGRKYWVSELLNGGASAKKATRAFFNSIEYIKKKTTDEQFVKDLYAGYLNRKPREKEVAHWMKQLQSGSSRNSLFDAFENSNEFQERKKKYTL